MKKSLQSMLSLIAVIAFAATATAQLPAGSIAPDFTATDINGVEHNLYDYLDQGKTVILDFSATWCGPCWSYHTAGTLETVWEEHGPGSANDDMMVFYIESDDTTTQADLEGTGGNTQGDWITGTNYPIIDNAANISDAFSVGYYPTIYTVCPSRVITETGQIGAEAHIDFAQANCAAPFAGVDGTILNYGGATAACGDVDLVVTMMSTGDQPLVNPVVDWVAGDGQMGSYTHDGTLAQWEMVEMNVGSVAVTQNMDVDFTITGDDNMENNAFSQALTLNESSTTHIRIDLSTDCYPQETGWEVVNTAGDVVASAPVGSYDGMVEMDIQENVYLEVGCYNFRFLDSYGDGMSGVQWGCNQDGSVAVYDVNGGTTLMILETGGTAEFEVAEGGFNADTQVSVNETEALNASVNVFPNPFNNETNVSVTLEEASNVEVVVYNVLGEIVVRDNFGQVSAGTFTTPVSFSGMEAGIYMINVEMNGSVITKRVTLTK